MRTFPSLAPVLLGACLLAAVAPAALGVAPDGHGRRPEPGTVAGTYGIPQTSDGVVGRIAPTEPPFRRAFTDISIRAKWQVAPGVQAAVWDQNDLRGPIRAYLLAVDWHTKGLRIDYANDGHVSRTAPVKQFIARDDAIAGVNGDFFDIGDTGAPLGIGRDRDRGLLNGRLSGWNSGFSIDRSGRPEIGPLAMTAKVAERPSLTITNVNSPEVQPGGVGVYNRSWGSTSGYRITGGQTRDVRMVLVRQHRVVRTSATLPSGTPIKGQMLVGRGDGAAQLARLHRGARVTITSRLAGRPAMAITGNKFLVLDGVIAVVDNREMHPRTAIGIDRDTHQILLLAIDGRQSFSRGYTMVELANLMIDLGADEALNLDGGGSTTMVAKRPNGKVRVINSPSSGSARSVANGVEVTYRSPSKR